jgi:hypothetical protein
MIENPPIASVVPSHLPQTKNQDLFIASGNSCMLLPLVALSYGMHLSY